MRAYLVGHLLREDERFGAPAGCLDRVKDGTEAGGFAGVGRVFGAAPPEDANGRHEYLLRWARLRAKLRGGAEGAATGRARTFGIPSSSPSGAVDSVRGSGRTAFGVHRRGRAQRGLIVDIRTDEHFAPLFPTHGQRALAPWRLALVSVFQSSEGLSDQQVAAAESSRVDWTYVPCLELSDAGFDASVLSEFRTRLRAGDPERLLLDTVLDWCRKHQLLKSRGYQRTDSTADVGAGEWQHQSIGGSDTAPVPPAAPPAPSVVHGNN